MIDLYVYGKPGFRINSPHRLAVGFNGSILDSATVAIALESVTATVIDLYVHWKPGFMLKMEALFSSGTRWQQSTGGSSLSAIRFGFTKLGSKDLGGVDAAMIGSSESIVLVLEGASNTSVKDLIVCLATVGINALTDWMNNRQQLVWDLTVGTDSIVLVLVLEEATQIGCGWTRFLQTGVVLDVLTRSMTVVRS